VTVLFDRLDQMTPLDDTEAEFVEQVRKAAAEKIAPRAEEYDQAEEFPWENMKLLNGLGLNGVFIPEEYGGTPLSYRGYLQLVEAISRACPATAITWATTFHAIGPVVQFGTPEQKSRFLPRIAAGGLAAAEELRVALRDAVLAEAPDAAEVLVEGKVEPGRSEAPLVQLRAVAGRP